MRPQPPKSAGARREAHRIDETKLDAWMASHVDDYTGDLQVPDLKSARVLARDRVDHLPLGGDPDRVYVVYGRL
jgi:hypothetical protein